MNSKENIIPHFERILWLERAMKERYDFYVRHLQDKELIEDLQQLEKDEIRHINMVEGILNLLRS